METPSQEDFDSARKVLTFLEVYYEEIDESMQKAVIQDAKNHVQIYEDNHEDEIQ